jgi:probable HAF family extracellular repeat protein
MNKLRTSMIGGVLLLLASATAIQPSAFAQVSSHHQSNYRVIDTGSFGGPNSHMSLGAHILNNDGTFTGFADTTIPDPYAPDGCWDGDCLVAHSFRWRNGRLIELGVLDSGPNSESNWMSPNGLIAGDSQDGLLDPLTGAWEIQGVLWKGDKTIPVGTLDGGSNSLARGVNNNGEVVGLSTTTTPDANALIMSFGLPYPFQTRAFRWKNGVMQDLGTLGGPDAIALGINERGQIFGNSYTDSNPSPSCSIPDFGFAALTTGAFLWDKGTMVNLGSLGGSCTNASAMNSAGEIVGYSFLSGDQVYHAFRWERGSLRDLGTTGGNFGAAMTLNDAGDVVGWTSLPGNDNIVHATLWSHGQIIDLGALGPDECSIPWGINSQKQVVGLVSLNCDFNDDNSLRAFLWEPGGPMVDLNTLISPDLGVQLRNVATINDRGEMAVVGWFPDETHRPVLLIPCGDARENDSCAQRQSARLDTLRASTPASPPDAGRRVNSGSVPMKLRARLTRGFERGRM